MRTLHRPETLDEACSLLTSLEDPMVYGGGTAIQILIKQGVLFASNFVDIALIPALDGIAATAEGIRVGPMVSVRRMETDPQVAAAVPLAAQTYGHVSNPRVRNTASVGGNIAHGDYRLDPPAALLVLDAQVEATSVRGIKRVPVREFFTGFQQTALDPDEIVTAIEIPAQPPGAGAAYAKLSSLGENDWPAASAAALIAGGPDGGVRLRLGLGALAPVPCFTEVDVTGLGARQTVDLAKQAAEPLLDPIPDIRGGVAFKKRLGLVAVEDAVTRAWEDRSDG